MAQHAFDLGTKKWGGKIFLAGEYTVTCGGSALAVYLEGHGGVWQLRPQALNAQKKEDAAWIKFGEWILAQDWPWFKREKWAQEFLNLEFVSDLPRGIGLGSSGALCAAIYDRFAHDEGPGLVDDQIVQQRLACLEGYFHGVSSGFDPLVCWRQQAYLMQGKPLSLPTARPWHLEQWRSRAVESSSSSSLNFFLWNCGIRRQTKNLMPYFQQLQQNDPPALAALQDAQQSLVLGLAALVQGQGDAAQIFSAWQEVANLEAKYLTPMIPPMVQSHWAGEQYQLKLCGAGGGGCFLGLARPQAALHALAQNGQVWRLAF